MMEALEQSLEALGLQRTEFSELCVRLLDHGVLSRDENRVERQLYDRFVRCEELIRDYFSVLAIRLWHDTDFRYVRLYPPGAQVPGEETVALPDSVSAQALRRRLTQQDVAVVLVLRHLYDEGVRAARVDAEGSVQSSLAEISVALQTLLARNLPEHRTERRALWRRLRQWRLVRWPEGEDPAAMDEGDATDLAVLIRPTLVSLVSDDALAQLVDTPVSSGSDFQTPGGAARGTD